MVRIIQITIYLLFVQLLRRLYRITTNAHTIPKLDHGPIVLIANHHKRIDPYIICASLPFTTFLRFTPINFFTADIYLRTWWQRLVLRPQGCFSTKPEQGTLSGLLGCLEIIDRKQSLLIFPEGERVGLDEQRPPYPGLGLLAQQRECQFLPVHLSYQQKTTVTWGKPFRLTPEQKKLPKQQLANQLFSACIP